MYDNTLIDSLKLEYKITSLRQNPCHDMLILYFIIVIIKLKTFPDFKLLIDRKLYTITMYIEVSIWDIYLLRITSLSLS